MLVLRGGMDWKIVTLNRERSVGVIASISFRENEWQAAQVS